MTVSLQQLLRTAADIPALEATVVESSRRAAAALTKILAESDPLNALARVKFDQVGFHPIQDRALNLIEQINQTFTFLASLRAAAWIFNHHPEVGPIRLNLGTSSGSDLESLGGELAAEAFAATTPSSNQKLRKDIAKVAATSARLKYVFYCCPSVPPGAAVPAPKNVDVRTVSLGWTSAQPSGVRSGAAEQHAAPDVPASAASPLRQGRG